MKVPAHTGMHHLTEDHLLPGALMRLLDSGAVIAGPGSDQHDSYFFREGEQYVYYVDPQPGEPSWCVSPATGDGFLFLLTEACFAGKYWSERL